MSAHDELDVMQKITEAAEAASHVSEARKAILSVAADPRLSITARARVLRWAADRYGMPELDTTED